MKARQAQRFALLIALVIVLSGPMACGRKEAPTAQGSIPSTQVRPWSCEILSGVLVVQGEVDRPTDLILEGRSIRETHHAEFGPVRWEMYRPPSGEVASLRTAEGQVLARWRFGVTPRMPRMPHVAQRKQERRIPESAAAPSNDPLEILRRQLATASRTPPPTPAPLLASLAPAPAPLPVLVPVMKTEWAPSSKRGAISEPLRPRLAADLNPLSQPQPLPIHPAMALSTPIPTGSSPWVGAGEAFNLVRGPKALEQGQRRMVLSFDGGSSDESAVEILDALKVRGVRTTIFLTGAFILKFPGLVHRMAREGHELGNHTMNHPHFAPGMRRDARWTKERFQGELLSADRALFQVLGRPMDPFWRAPYGEQTKELREWAEEIGFRHVGWSEGADALDWATPNEKRLYRSGDAVLDRLHARLTRRDADGLIVLMHLGSGRQEADRPSKNLGAFMDRAMKEGWHFVKASDYLQELHKPAWDPLARLDLIEQRGGSSTGRASLKK